MITSFVVKLLARLPRIVGIPQPSRMSRSSVSMWQISDFVGMILIIFDFNSVGFVPSMYKKKAPDSALVNTISNYFQIILRCATNR